MSFTGLYVPCSLAQVFEGLFLYCGISFLRVSCPEARGGGGGGEGLFEAQRLSVWLDLPDVESYQRGDTKNLNKIVYF